VAGAVGRDKDHATAKSPSIVPRSGLDFTCISHAIGISCGGFAGYWEVERRHTFLKGGFIWDWADQGIEAEHHTADGSGGAG